MSQFRNKTVIVTGAGTGIGRAIVHDFVQAGARVALMGRRIEKLEEAAAGLPQAQVLFLSCDVANREAVNRAVQEVITRFGPVDIVVNNAGTNTNPRSVAEVDPNDWDRTIAINLTGAFNVIRAVIPGMRERRDGLIINISSIAGLRASKLSGAAYSASKHGMVALTHSLNEEEKDYNIRACVICPGEVNTPIIDLRPEPVSQERRAEMLQPEDVSAAALFVAGLPARVCIPEIIIKPTHQIYR